LIIGSWILDLGSWLLDLGSFLDCGQSETPVPTAFDQACTKFEVADASGRKQLSVYPKKTSLVIKPLALDCIISILI